MRKPARVLAIVAGVLGLVFVIAWGVARARLNTTYAVPPTHFRAPAPDKQVADRGANLATMHACTHCHGPDMGGSVMGSGVLIGALVPPNLTRHPAGIGGRLTDEDWARAVRHAVNRQGKPLLLMPGEHSYADMSDEDLGAIVAYARALPPVDHHLPRPHLGPGAQVLVAMGMLPIYTGAIDHRTRPYVPQPGVTVRNGQYLAQMCSPCHASDFGGVPPGLGVPPGANLTSAGVMKDWGEEDFLRFLHTGVTPQGRKVDPKTMPWNAFALMRDDEMRSLWAYLGSVPPVTRGQAPAKAPAPAAPAHS
jgi:cytochrome c553